MNVQQVQLDSCKLYSIVWIVAIDIELRAASAMLDEEHEQPTDFEKNESDDNKYTWGRIGKHNILIAPLPAGNTGTTSAAITVSSFRSSLPHIKFGVLVGIGGAIPKTTELEGSERIDKSQDIRLGDVAVGLPHGSAPGVIEYDRGKNKQGRGWERTGSLNQPPKVLLSVVQHLKAKGANVSEWMQNLLHQMIAKDPSLEEDNFMYQGAKNDQLFRANYIHQPSSPDCSRCDALQTIPRPERKSTKPAIHYGVILSGNTVMRNAKNRDSTAKRMSENSICYEMEAAGIAPQLPCLMIRGMCDYADSHKNDVWQRYAAATAAAYAKILILSVDPQVPAKNATFNEVALLLAPEYEAAENSCEIVASAADREVLSHLPISAQARHDSLEEGESPLCLPKTRQDVLKRLSDWLEKEPSRTFWLNGMAGTGKSTISRSFAKDLNNRGQLGASFFFKRDDRERGRAQRFSSTIAADLAGRFRAARASIIDTLQRKDRITDTEAQQQFQLLVLAPLSKVQLDKNIAIVIDAVDECDEADLKSLFALVSTFQKAKLPGVKLFFTSRPDLAVLREYNPALEEKHSTIALHKVKPYVIDSDILIYLEHELGQVRESYNRSVGESERLAPSWPSREHQEKLLKMSNQLFIFAATICRLLSKSTMNSPDLQLRDLLELKTTTSHAFEPIYRPVLDRLISKKIDISQDSKQQLICEYKQVLGAICVLHSPVSVPALARLLGIDVKVIDHRLRSLRSVIEVISPRDSTSREETLIRLLHRSFGDFLMSKEVRNISPIWVDEQDAHHVMMNCCLATLNRPNTGLRFNICGLDIPGTPRSDVPLERLRSCFTIDLAYACRHLTSHAVLAGFKIKDNDEIHKFLLSHLLHWLEASAYLGDQRNPARDFLHLKSLASPESEVRKLLKDACRFAAAYWKISEHAPLQIYTVIFTPTESIVRKAFERKYNDWVLEKPVIGHDWDTVLSEVSVSPLPAEGILKLLFSPDKSTLAAMSWDSVWFMTLFGEQIFQTSIDNPLEDCELPVAVVFSSSSKLIALRNGIDEIAIWNIEKQAKVALLEMTYGADYFHRPRSFTHNDSCVLMASHHFADICSIESRTVVNRTYFPSAAHDVAVSPDCSILAGLFDDGLILWNIESRRPVDRVLWRARYNEATSYDLVLSSNKSAWIITTGWAGNQAVYSTTSAEPLAFLQEEYNAYTISEDYLIVEYDDKIRTWQLGNTRPQVIKKPRPGPVKTIAYISNPSMLVSSPTNDIQASGVVFFSRLPKYQPRSMQLTPLQADAECGDQLSELFLNSPNGTMLASIGPDGARIVSARPGSASVVFQEGLEEEIAFSSTGDFFTTIDNNKLRLWERTGYRNATLRNSYSVDKRYNIESASFSSDAHYILVVLHDNEVSDNEVPDNEGRSCLVLLTRQSLEPVWEHTIPLRLFDAVLSPGDRLLAAIGRDAVWIWDINTDSVSSLKLKITAEVGDVRISANSALALLICEETLEFWDIERGIILYSQPRDAIMLATFDPWQDFILTNRGKAAYYIDYATVEALWLQVSQERKLLLDFSEDNIMSLRHIGWGIAKDRTWITWNGQNWIRLPTNYCATCSAVDGNHVLIVNEATVEARYEFADEPCFKEHSNDVDVEMMDYKQEATQGLGIGQIGWAYSAQLFDI